MLLAFGRVSLRHRLSLVLFVVLGLFHRSGSAAGDVPVECERHNGASSCLAIVYQISSTFDEGWSNRAPRLLPASANAGDPGMLQWPEAARADDGRGCASDGRCPGPPPRSERNPARWRRRSVRPTAPPTAALLAREPRRPSVLPFGRC